MSGAVADQYRNLSARLLLLQSHMLRYPNDLDARKRARKVASRLMQIITHRRRKDVDHHGAPGPRPTADVV